MTNKKLTKEQAAIIGAYTGITCGSFSDIHKLAEELLKRPIFTHEFASKVLNDELKEKVKPMFLELCHDGEAEEVPEDNIKIQPKPVVDNKIETNNEVERALKELREEIKETESTIERVCKVGNWAPNVLIMKAQNLVDALEAEESAMNVVKDALKEGIRNMKDFNAKMDEKYPMSKPEPKIDIKEKRVDLPKIKLPVAYPFTNASKESVFFEGKEIKSGERIVMTKPSVEPVSIWKNISELPRNRAENPNGAAVFYERDGQTFIAEAHTFYQDFNWINKAR